MNYEQCQKIVAESLHLTGKYSEKQSFPFYIKHLLISPNSSSREIESGVLMECTKNGFNNKEALESFNFINDDTELFVFVVGIENEMYAYKKISDYLSGT